MEKDIEIDVQFSRLLLNSKPTELLKCKFQTDVVAVEDVIQNLKIGNARVRWWRFFRKYVRILDAASKFMRFRVQDAIMWPIIFFPASVDAGMSRPMDAGNLDAE